jgi:hypothetical protein
MKGWFLSREKGVKMSSLEKILIAIAMLLAIVLVVLLMMPNASGQSNFQSLSPEIDKASVYLARVLASFTVKLSAWTGSIQAWVRQAGAPSGANSGQGNPVDSAVRPVGSYGEEQKDVFKKPVEGLQH